MDAAELLAYLEAMLNRGVPLHKLRIRIEVGDSYYDSDIEEEWQIYEEEYNDGKRLIFKGKR